MLTGTRWWQYRRHSADGRVEVVCRAIEDHVFSLSNRELATWTACAHCAGWLIDRPEAGAPQPG
jgi:hypothetical protein